MCGLETDVMRRHRTCRIVVGDSELLINEPRVDARIEDFGDIGVVHEGQRLALLIEAGERARGVDAGPHDLDRNAAPNGLDLVGDPDFSHAAGTEPLA